MKQLLFSKALLSAATLMVGTLVFTACSNDEFDGNTNPTYDGESVKTQFAINIPAGKKSTRLGSDIVQASGATDFRGMDNIKLIPFSNTSLATAEPFTSDAIILDAIDKGTGGETNLKGGARIYKDIAVPVGTKYFLFYAEATRSGDTSDKANGSITAPDEFNNGDLLNGVSTLNKLYFTLTGINTENNAIETYLVGILNNVTNSLSTNAGDNETLKAALANMKTVKVGSSDAILAVMQDLYDVVKNGGTAANTNIASAITDFFTDDSGTLSYNTSATGYVTDANNYPACLGLPNGAAQVKYEGGFQYISENSSDFATYTYPASLYYYVGSIVGASDATHLDAWGGSSVENWETFVGSTNYSDDVVKASTQSVVLKSPINYAVAQLQYTVRFDVVGNELEDNRGNKRAIDNNFKLKGILIGQQNGVDYKFEQNATLDAKTIYDPITETAITTSASTPFYTLALQSAQRTDVSEQKSVNIALEFVNEGEDFYGVDGIVPQGGTFYLAGTLQTNSTQTENNYVFEKDHKTVATILIKSLKDAKYTIPDLRETKLELGLYVDLVWGEGLTDDVTIQ